MIDYIQYRLGKGRYSAARLRAMNATLGEPDNFRDLAAFKPADLFLLHTRHSFLSWLVMYYTDSIWSHSGMFVSDDGDVVDATTGGVVKHHFYDYCDGETYIAVMRPNNMTVEARAKAARFMENAVAAAYDWKSVVRLFVLILFGAHKPYCARFFGDIVLLFLPIMFAGLWFSWAMYSGVVILICYIAIVAVNVAPRCLFRKNEG